MKFWCQNICKLIWAAYLLVTSAYCILAIPPYTYYAFIKAPPYPWMTWFAAHHVALYWAAMLAAAAGYWTRQKSKNYFVNVVLCALLGFAITTRPFIQSVQGNRSTLIYAFVSLLPVLLWSIRDVLLLWAYAGPRVSKSFSYAGPVAAAVFVAVLGAAGLQLQGSREMSSSISRSGDLLLTVVSICSHLALAILILSFLNLVRAITGKTSFGWAISGGAALLAVIGWTWFATSGFLEGSLSFPHTIAIAYSFLLASTLTLFGFSFVLPIVKRPEPEAAVKSTITRKTIAFVVLGLAAALALYVPASIGVWDWDGLVQRTFAIALWGTALVCFGLLIPRHKHYSVPAILATLIITGFVYEGLKSTEIVWAKTLGPTDDEISKSIQAYASRDYSFAIAYRLLGNAPHREPCNELCHILLEYTNVPEFHITQQVNLVDDLSAKPGDRPNIFIFVIDSMRPDYLGAYNQKVDFTPNLDAFARDSVVFRRAYTQYAGTTLSEPAIWSGTMLLHSHYTQPFSNLNNLEKLVNAEDYKMVLSYDTVLHQILSPKDEIVRLDADKQTWNNYETCSTVQQLTTALDARTDKNQPVFFYSQPMNVHQFAHNDYPPARIKDWHRSSFNPRVSKEVSEVDECLGKFIVAIKERGLYDNSVIVVASDHGDALGDFGRHSHALILYPEIVHVPLIVHLPKSMQGKFVYDVNELAALTDITPSLDYLLGHHHIQRGPMFGHSLFAQSREELQQNVRHELFLASDIIAVYGILADDGRFLYTASTYPSNKSELFDLTQDPNAERNILTPELKRKYDERLIDYLKLIGDFYGYKPGVASLLANRR
jgi:arylsulfatase A-like enzyme